MNRALVCFVTVAVVSSVAHGASFEEDAFIGWQGETYKPDDPLNKAASSTGAWIETVSWAPRVAVFHNFLSDEEAVHIKRLAAPTMRRSTVVGANGSSVTDDYRTSYGTFLKRKQDDIVTRVEERLSNWAKIPLVNGEDLQVLRYGVGQFYKPHMDTLRDKVSGPRVATVLLYLNDVGHGGETAFSDTPPSHWVDPQQGERYDAEFSECAKHHVAFKPRKGDALIFWSIKPDGVTEDPWSMHTGCSVVRGVKWTATKWFHARPFRPESLDTPDRTVDADVGYCEDIDETCDTWAARGECTANHGFMVGDAGAVGHCRRACKACQPCASREDHDCYNRNRQEAGFLVFDWDELADSKQ